MKSVLIIDDEDAVCWALQQALTQEGYRVDIAASAEVGLEKIGQQRFDAILLDVRLPGIDGISAIAKIRLLLADTTIIVMTAFGSLEIAVRAVENGAFDYLAKPFDLAQALDIVRRAVEIARVPDDGKTLPALTNEEIVGRSSAMQAVFKRIAFVAPRDAAVLITGESGTGKELVARALHRHSPRKDQPFLPVHIAALNPNLIESELFGHVRGAFTGANQMRRGLLSLADGGTLFLDEIAEVPLVVQGKLLRVLEQREYYPVGGACPEALNVRLVAATHQNMERCVAEGRFRQDLYFRLNVFGIHLPPLRERLDDLPALVEYLLQRMDPSALPLNTATLDYIRSHLWPGNVRELRNALEHAVIVARGGPLKPEHFPTWPDSGGHTVEQELERLIRRWVADRVTAQHPQKPMLLHQQMMQHVEAALLDEVLKRVRGNRLIAGEWLGLNRATVRKKLTQYTLEATDPNDPL